MLVMRRFQRLHRGIVLVRRIAHELLHVRHPLGDRRVVRGGRIQVAGVLRDGVGMLLVRCLQGCHLPLVLVRGVAAKLLEVAHTLAHGRVVDVQRLQRAHVLLRLAMRRRELRMLLPQGRELAGVLVRRVAEQVLDVLHSLGQRGVVASQVRHAGELLRVLVVRLLQRLELPAVLVGRVAHQLLHVAEALLEGCVGLGGAVAALGVLVVRQPERLDLLRVLVR
mmetsp:Transcript_31894/g.96424  ORF Transcript_31894/g.96424 Transcript_31894/m.96424 type:complete len:223 (+) Transcript_31894:1155-1823(+)